MSVSHFRVGWQNKSFSLLEKSYVYFLDIFSLSAPWKYLKCRTDNIILINIKWRRYLTFFLHAVKFLISESGDTSSNVPESTTNVNGWDPSKRPAYYGRKSHIVDRDRRRPDVRLWRNDRWAIAPDQRSTYYALHNLVSGFNITVMDQIVVHASSFHQRAWLGIQDVADTVGTHWIPTFSAFLHFSVFKASRFGDCQLQFRAMNLEQMCWHWQTEALRASLLPPNFCYPALATRSRW